MSCPVCVEACMVGVRTIAESNCECVYAACVACGDAVPVPVPSCVVDYSLSDDAGACECAGCGCSPDVAYRECGGS